MKGRRQTYYIAARHVEYPNFGRKNSGVFNNRFLSFPADTAFSKKSKFFRSVIFALSFPFLQDTSGNGLIVRQYTSISFAHIPPLPTPSLRCNNDPAPLPPTNNFFLAVALQVYWQIGQIL